MNDPHDPREIGGHCIIVTSQTMPGTQRTPWDVFLCLIFPGNKNFGNPSKLGPHRLSTSVSGDKGVIPPQKEPCPAKVPVELEGKRNGGRKEVTMTVNSNLVTWAEARTMADVFCVLSCFLCLPSLKHTC